MLCTTLSCRVGHVHVRNRSLRKSSHRSELIGLLSGVMLAEGLQQQWCPSSVLRPIVQIGCDGLTALSQAFCDVFLSPTQAQFDILSTIHAWRQSSPIQWRPRHVYGRQDSLLLP